MNQLALVFAALTLLGCPTQGPLPKMPPPEYEAPRSYDPGKNIDHAGQDAPAVEGSEPPAEPPAEPPPVEAAPPAPTAPSAPSPG